MSADNDQNLVLATARPRRRAVTARAAHGRCRSRAHPSWVESRQGALRAAVWRHQRSETASTTSTITENAIPTKGIQHRPTPRPSTPGAHRAHATNHQHKQNSRPRKQIDQYEGQQCRSRDHGHIPSQAVLHTAQGTPTPPGRPGGCPHWSCQRASTSSGQRGGGGTCPNPSLRPSKRPAALFASRSLSQNSTMRKPSQTPSRVPKINIGADGILAPAMTQGIHAKLSR